MPAAQFYSPQVPGITDEVGEDKASIPVFKALAEEDEGRRANQLVSVAKSWFEAQRTYYREAVECVAFYYGSQWGYFNNRESRWIARPEPRSSDQVRLIANQIKPVVDQATALLTQETPIFGCAAAKDEARDSAASKSADAVLDYYWRQKRLTEVYRNSARDAFITGTAPVLVEWDESAGAEVDKTRTDPNTGEEVPETIPVADPQDPMKVTDQPVKIRQGDLTFRLVSRECLAFEPGAETDQSGAGIFFREKPLRSDLKERYPEKMKDVADGAAQSTEPAQDDVRIAEQSSPRSPRTSLDTKSAQRVDVYTLYLKSCENYPRGLMLKFTEGVILYEGDNPIYPQQDEPDELWPRVNWPVFFVKCDDRTTGPWGAGRVVGMIPYQMALNGVVSKTIQHIATIANTKIILPKGLDSDVSDEIGQVIRVSRMTPTGQIAYLSPPPMPQEFITAWDRLKAEIEYHAGINAATLGNAPTSDASGIAISRLQKQDTGRIAPVKRSIDATWGEIMRYGLFLFRRYASVKRKILIVGENNQISLKFLAKADIAAATDVLVFNDQMIPRDPTQRSLWLTQFTQNMAQVQDQAQRKALLKMYRLKDFERFLVDLDPDDDKAERMVQLIMLMEPVYVTPYDSAISIKATLERWMKSREYESTVLKEKGPGTGYSRTEDFTSKLLAYYTGVATGDPMVPPMPPQFVPPPPVQPPMGAPPAPPAMPAMPGAPPMPSAPMGGAPPSEVPPPDVGIPPASAPMAPVNMA